MTVQVVICVYNLIESCSLNKEHAETIPKLIHAVVAKIIVASSKTLKQNLPPGSSSTTSPLKVTDLQLPMDFPIKAQS